MNVFSFVQWYIYFHSPHENICTIALISINHLYIILPCSEGCIVALVNVISCTLPDVFAWRLDHTC